MTPPNEVLVRKEGYKIRISIGIKGEFKTCFIEELKFSDIMKVRAFLEKKAKIEIDEQKSITLHWGSDEVVKFYGKYINRLEIFNTYLERKRKLAPKVELFDI